MGLRTGIDVESRYWLFMVEEGKMHRQTQGALLLIPANESGEQNPHLERGSAGSCCQGEEPELNFIILSITSWSWRGVNSQGVLVLSLAV